MEKCYEYFNCSHIECLAHTENVICWEIEGTLCNSAHTAGFQTALKEFGSDNLKCNYCIYKKKTTVPDKLYKDKANSY